MKTLKKSSCKDIARCIVLAQIASDGGKNIYSELAAVSGGHRAAAAGYSLKDGNIKKAISLISSRRECGITYSVCEDASYSNKTYLIYFTFYIEGVRKQVSFHSPGEDKFYKKISCSSRKTTWDKKSSRKACQDLANYLHL